MPTGPPPAIKIGTKRISVVPLAERDAEQQASCMLEQIPTKRPSGRCLQWVARVDIAKSAPTLASESWGADLAPFGRLDKSDGVAQCRRGS